MTGPKLPPSLSGDAPPDQGPLIALPSADRPGEDIHIHRGKVAWVQPDPSDAERCVVVMDGGHSHRVAAYALEVVELLWPEGDCDFGVWRADLVHGDRRLPCEAHLRRADIVAVIITTGNRVSLQTRTGDWYELVDARSWGDAANVYDWAANHRIAIREELEERLSSGPREPVRAEAAPGALDD